MLFAVVTPGAVIWFEERILIHEPIDIHVRAIF
jgi:hypothetical protein